MELIADQECVASSRRSGDRFEFLTVLEIATVLRVNPQTVRNWIQHGTLPAVKLGRSVRIRRTDLETYLEASRVKPRGSAMEIGKTGHLPASILWAVTSDPSMREDQDGAPARIWIGRSSRP